MNNGTNEIVNNALSSVVAGKTPSAGLAFYIAVLWRAIVTVGGLAFIVFLVWGGIQWLISGGDKAKTQEAGNRITAALVGLAIIAASWALIQLISYFFGIDVLGGVVNIPKPF